MLRAVDASDGGDLVEAVDEGLALQVGVDQGWNNAGLGAAEPQPNVFLSRLR